jgi:hypothetical protein
MGFFKKGLGWNKQPSIAKRIFYRRHPQIAADSPTRWLPLSQTGYGVTRRRGKRFIFIRPATAERIAITPKRRILFWNKLSDLFISRGGYIVHFVYSAKDNGKFGK